MDTCRQRQRLSAQPMHTWCMLIPECHPSNSRTPLHRHRGQSTSCETPSQMHLPEVTGAFPELGEHIGTAREVQVCGTLLAEVTRQPSCTHDTCYTCHTYSLLTPCLMGSHGSQTPPARPLPGAPSSAADAIFYLLSWGVAWIISSHLSSSSQILSLAVSKSGCQTTSGVFSLKIVFVFHFQKFYLVLG